MFPAGSVPTSSAVGVGYRFLALIIDALLLLLITCPLSIISFVANDGETADFSGISAVMNCLGLLVFLGYFIGMETLRGATVGKMALGLKVVKTDGSQPDWGTSVVRNLLRFVDTFPYFIPYLLGAILIWSSPTRQRLGDRVAGTMVVRKDAVPEIAGFETQRF